MRSYSITLAQNLGSGLLGATLDVTAQRVSIGPWRWEADKELTRISPGELPVTLADPDLTTWTWLSTQTPSSAGLLPPFLVVDIDGERSFTGLVPPDRWHLDKKRREIKLTAQDWSAMLSSQTLGALSADDDDNSEANPWLRPAPKAAENKPESEAYEGRPEAGSLIVSNFQRNLICVAEPANWVQVGDMLAGTVGATQRPLSGLKTLKIEHNAATPPAFPGFQCLLTVNQDVWLGNDFSGFVGTFRRVASPVTSTTYFTVTKAVADPDPPIHQIELNTVDGIVPGDELTLIGSTQSQSWTALQVDAQQRVIHTREEVTDLAVNDRIYFSAEAKRQQVYMDARLALQLATAPYGLDLSRYQPPILPVPVLTWLPMRPLTGSDLTNIKDLDAGLMDVRAHGSSSLAWDGTPEGGWSPAAQSLRAVWTDQRLTTPSSLMPDETQATYPKSFPRNRAYDLRYRSGASRSGDAAPTGPWDPVTAKTPEGILVYDYLQTRRIKIQGNTATLTPWTGTAWGTPSTATLAIGTPLSASVFPGQAGRVLVLTSTGLHAVTLPGGTVRSVSIPDGAKDAVLKPSPWGAFLVGSKGYGRVTLANEVLNVAWVGLTEVSSFYPGTFCALDEETCFSLARFDAQDADGKTLTETHALTLSANPTTAQASVRSSERILEGAPITLGALRDPSQPGRILGHCGGRMFQFSKRLPLAYALERFKPTGMRASELIEHICQVLHAVAIPDALGVLHIVSRASTESPIALTVDQMDVEETRAWEHHYSHVRVAGEQEDLYADAPGEGETGPQGGGVLEVSGHPLLWTRSGCLAMAKAMHSFFSIPRRIQTQKWVHTNPNTPGPWESLPPLCRLKINGDPTTWLLMGLEDNKTAGEARATLLEVF